MEEKSWNTETHDCPLSEDRKVNLRRMAAWVDTIFRPDVLVAIALVVPIVLTVWPMGTGASGLSFAEPRFTLGFVLYTLSCLGAFEAAYYGFRYLSIRPELRSYVERREVVDKTGLATGLGLIVILVLAGSAVIVATVSDRSRSEMVTAFVSGRGVRDVLYGPEGFVRSSTVPGAVRMVGYGVVGAYVLLSAVTTSYWRQLRRRRTLLVAATALVAGGLFLRSILVADRFPILGASIVLALTLASVRLTYPPLPKEGAGRRAMSGLAIVTMSLVLMLVGSFVLGLTLVKHVDSVRGLGALGESSVLLYAKLGVLNTIYAMQSTTSHTWGFESLLAPVRFVARGLGWSVSLPNASRYWVWNPAGNLMTYAFVDFGYAGCITFALLGAVAGRSRKAIVRTPKSVLARAVYLLVVMALASIWIVPIFRGPDFWFALMAVTGSGYLIDRLGGSWSLLAYRLSWR